MAGIICLIKFHCECKEGFNKWMEENGMDRVKLNGGLSETNVSKRKREKIKIIIETKRIEEFKRERDNNSKWLNQRTQLTRTRSPSLTDKESRNPERISTSPLRV